MPITLSTSTIGPGSGNTILLLYGPGNLIDPEVCSETRRHRTTPSTRVAVRVTRLGAPVAKPCSPPPGHRYEDRRTRTETRGTSRRIRPRRRRSTVRSPGVSMYPRYRGERDRLSTTSIGPGVTSGRWRFRWTGFWSLQLARIR